MGLSNLNVILNDRILSNFKTPHVSFGWINVLKPTVFECLRIVTFNEDVRG